MDVVLPSTGCNILSNNGVLYNYTNSGRTRTTYVIYEGKLFKSSESTSTTGYSYNGDCLRTGDIVYSPASTVYFTHLAILSCILILFIPVRLFWFNWWRRLK